MGGLLGHTVRFDAADQCTLSAKASRRCCRCAMCCPACRLWLLSRPATLPRYCSPLTLRRLYIARDADVAGDMALAELTERAQAAGIDALILSPRVGDFNEDLCTFGLDALRPALRIQLAPQDVGRFTLFAEPGRLIDRPSALPAIGQITSYCRLSCGLRSKSDAGAAQPALPAYRPARCRNSAATRVKRPSNHVVVMQALGHAIHRRRVASAFC